MQKVLVSVPLTAAAVTTRSDRLTDALQAEGVGVAGVSSWGTRRPRRCSKFLRCLRGEFSSALPPGLT